MQQNDLLDKIKAKIADNASLTVGQTEQCGYIAAKVIAHNQEHIVTRLEKAKDLIAARFNIPVDFREVEGYSQGFLDMFAGRVIRIGDILSQYPGSDRYKNPTRLPRYESPSEEYHRHDERQNQEYALMQSVIEEHGFKFIPNHKVMNAVDSSKAWRIWDLGDIGRLSGYVITEADIKAHDARIACNQEPKQIFYPNPSDAPNPDERTGTIREQPLTALEHKLQAMENRYASLLEACLGSLITSLDPEECEKHSSNSDDLQQVLSIIYDVVTADIEAHCAKIGVGTPTATETGTPIGSTSFTRVDGSPDVYKSQTPEEFFAKVLEEARRMHPKIIPTLASVNVSGASEVLSEKIEARVRVMGTGNDPSSRNNPNKPRSTLI